MGIRTSGIRTSGIRTSLTAWGLITLLPLYATAATFSFEDVSLSIHYVNSPPVGPGLFPSTPPPGALTPAIANRPPSVWGEFLENGSVANNGVTLTLSGFPEIAFPSYVIVGKPDPYNGTPAFVLSQSLQTNVSAQFALSNVPPAPKGFTYDLALYSTNFDANGGTVFSINLGGGHADKGINSAINDSDLGTPNDSYKEGVNYVLYDNIVPVDGLVEGTVEPFPFLIPQAGPPVPNPITLEANLNGLQLVTVPLPTAVPTFTIVAMPEPGTFSLLVIGAAGLLGRRSRAS